jgi:DNA repair photolyase
MAVKYREEPCKSAMNQAKGMPFRWTLNPYMGCVHRCTYCYVRAYEKRADRPSDDRYGTSIRVKTNVAHVLRWELEKRSWRGETVVIGAATDPYQPAEGTYRLTRQCIEVLMAKHNSFGIITRGPMIVRDAELLAEASARADVEINVSIPTLDEDVWRKTEPGTSPPRQRFRAVKTLVDAGVKVNVAMAPVLPGISDAPEQLEEVVKASREAGATGLWANLLHLRPGTREHFMSQLARDWPELLQRYKDLYRFDAYLKDDVTKPTRDLVTGMRERYGIGDRRRQPVMPPPKAEQLSLLEMTAAAVPAVMGSRVRYPMPGRASSAA